MASAPSGLAEAPQTTSSGNKLNDFSENEITKFQPEGRISQFYT